MPTTLIERYDDLILKADEYHKKALWQEKLRVLQELHEICQNGGLPESGRREQDVLYDLGAIRRRLGHYNLAEELLQKALQVDQNSGPLRKAYIFGELVVVLRHTSRFEEALDACNQQYELAQSVEPGLDADVEQCRAVGNAGMCAYNLASRLANGDVAKVKLLEKAELQLLERIERAQKLQETLMTDPNSKWAAMSKIWETIGLDRLSLVYVEQGRFTKSLEIARVSQAKQDRIDPTVTAYSKFFYGNALWYNGQQDAALEQWNAPPGVCSSPVALCKEISKEQNGYLRRLADAGVDFDNYDEQGFSALDYVALSESADATEAEEIVVAALRDAFEKQTREQNPTLDDIERQSVVQDMVTRRGSQAEVRRQYRNLFQESFRPKLQAVQASTSIMARRSAIQELRSIYKEVLADKNRRQMLWPFHYLGYEDLKRSQKLPIYSANFTNVSTADSFVIFISYRWRGGKVPDDSSDTQFRRIVEAVEEYLKISPHLTAQDVAIWLDYACIDQVDLENKLRGVDSLPIAVTLCDAMISLVEDSYYERAWCGVEVMLIDTLATSYGIHQRLEHVQTAEGSFLRHVESGRTVEVDRLKLTNERDDRPKIEFLMRQSKLIGREA